MEKKPTPQQAWYAAAELQAAAAEEFVISIAGLTSVMVGSTAEYTRTFNHDPATTDTQYWTVNGAEQGATGSTFTFSPESSTDYHIAFFHRDMSGVETTSNELTVSAFEP